TIRCFLSTCHLSIARNSQWILPAATNPRTVACCCYGRRSANSGCAGRLADAMPDRRDVGRIRHDVFEMVMARVSAIACGHKDAIDLDRLRHDPLMKLAVGRCPQSDAPLASQSTISRLENAPSKTEAVRLTAALVDQAGTSVKPRAQEILDIDDTFCAAHGGQQLAF